MEPKSKGVVNEYGRALYRLTSTLLDDVEHGRVAPAKVRAFLSAHRAQFALIELALRTSQPIRFDG